MPFGKIKNFFSRFTRAPVTAGDTIPEDEELQIEETLRREDVDIRDVYDIGKILGSGSFGQVREAHYKENGEVRAVKIVESDDSDGEWSRQVVFVREVGLLQQLQHENIVTFWDFFEDCDFYYIVMEYCTGGELFQRILEVKRFSESDAGFLGFQMLLALNYIHSLKIVHRDVKAENFLFAKCGLIHETPLKLIDFGMAVKRNDDSQLLHELCGSPHYLAPELIGQQYNNLVDLWAMGVLMYLLLYGRYPYDAKDPQELMVKILTEPIEWRHPKAKISDAAMSFLSCLLNRDVRHRYNSRMAMKQTWVAQNMLRIGQTLKPVNQTNKNALSYIKELQAEGHRIGPLSRQNSKDGFTAKKTCENNIPDNSTSARAPKSASAPMEKGLNSPATKTGTKSESAKAVAQQASETRAQFDDKLQNLTDAQVQDGNADDTENNYNVTNNAESDIVKDNLKSNSGYVNDVAEEDNKSSSPRSPKPPSVTVNSRPGSSGGQQQGQAQGDSNNQFDTNTGTGPGPTLLTSDAVQASDSDTNVKKEDIANALATDDKKSKTKSEGKRSSKRSSNDGNMPSVTPDPHTDASEVTSSDDGDGQYGKKGSKSNRAGETKEEKEKREEENRNAIKQFVQLTVSQESMDTFAVTEEEYTPVTIPMEVLRNARRSSIASRKMVTQLVDNQRNQKLQALEQMYKSGVKTGHRMGATSEMPTPSPSETPSKQMNVSSDTRTIGGQQTNAAGSGINAPRASLATMIKRKLSVVMGMDNVLPKRNSGRLSTNSNAGVNAPVTPRQSTIDGGQLGRQSMLSSAGHLNTIIGQTGQTNTNTGACPSSKRSILHESYTFVPTHPPNTIDLSKLQSPGGQNSESTNLVTGQQPLSTQQGISGVPRETASFVVKGYSGDLKGGPLGNQVSVIEGGIPVRNQSMAAQLLANKAKIMAQNLPSSSMSMHVNESSSNIQPASSMSMIGGPPGGLMKGIGVGPLTKGVTKLNSNVTDNNMNTLSDLNGVSPGPVKGPTTEKVSDLGSPSLNDLMEENNNEETTEIIPLPNTIITGGGGNMKKPLRRGQSQTIGDNSTKKIGEKLPRRLSYIGHIDFNREQEFASLFQKNTSTISEAIPETIPEKIGESATLG